MRVILPNGVMKRCYSFLTSEIWIGTAVEQRDYFLHATSSRSDIQRSIPIPPLLIHIKQFFA